MACIFRYTIKDHVSIPYRIDNKVFSAVLFLDTPLSLVSFLFRQTSHPLPPSQNTSKHSPLLYLPTLKGVPCKALPRKAILALISSDKTHRPVQSINQRLTSNQILRSFDLNVFISYIYIFPPFLRSLEKKQLKTC